MTKRALKGPSDEKVFAGAEMTEVLAEALMMIESHVGALMMTVARAEVSTRTARGVPSTTTVLSGVALRMTEVPVEAWRTPEVPGVGPTMTGVPEEEGMTRGVEGEAWTMGRAVVRTSTTAKPGSP